MKIFKGLIYVMLALTPWAGWLILYILMKQEQNKKDGITVELE